jgi:hypothetical protein
VKDAHGNLMPDTVRPVDTSFKDGVAVRGRVIRADGSPAPFVPVTVTMHDPYKDPFDRCDPIIDSRVCQKMTDSNGAFSIDFVHGGVGFTISAVDTGGLTLDAVNSILESSPGGIFDKEKLLAQAVQTSINQAFGTTTVQEAVSLVEGLDRAVWQDHIDLQGGQVGKEIVVALRFRGRGMVTGQVVGPDGSTPVIKAAVNLFPDIDSRELARGVFSDSNGSFEFRGVPLGHYTIQVQSSQGHFRTIVGQLEHAKDTNFVKIVLTAPVQQEIVRGNLHGRVVEPDNLTPHSGAKVYIQHVGESIVAVLDAAEDGFWAADNVPTGDYSATAVSRDGKRSGQTTLVPVFEGKTAFLTVTLNGVGMVDGRVETSNGTPVAQALVAGGNALVRTDANGFFHLEGVPLGARGISAGLESQYAPGGFPRLGSANLNVLPGVNNFVVVRLRPAGQIVGQVRDANGTPVPDVKVAIPLPPDRFAWVKADDEGRFKFVNMPPKDYYVSAPSPPVQERDNEDLLDQIQNGSDEEIAAAVAEAFTTFAGLNDPFLNGTNVVFNPGSWGYTTAKVRFDGETVIANISYLPNGTISGIVQNDQGVPIGAKVRLTGLGPDGLGAPALILKGDRLSDPSSGQFQFLGAIVGDWGVQAANPFYPVVIEQHGRTTKLEPNVTNLVLQFPPIREYNGRLTGRVFQPDGTLVGANVNVKIGFGNDYIIRTDTNGFFDTQIKIPASGYQVEASDPVSGLRGTATAQVKAGLTNYVEVTLLGKGSLVFQAFKGDGSPAAGATVQVNQGSYPGERFTGETDVNGLLRLDNLFAGVYSIESTFRTGLATFRSRLGTGVQAGQTTTNTTQFGFTAGVSGRFVKRDDGSPIAFARVAIGNLAYEATDEDGDFEAQGLPLGNYTIIATDPVTGQSGVGSVALNDPQTTVQVTIVQQAQGELHGTVYQTGVSTPIAGATIRFTSSNPVAASQTVTTGPDGTYSFTGVVPGAFLLSANYRPSFGASFDKNLSGVFPENGGSVQLDITLPAPKPLGSITVTVVEPDGVTPVPQAKIEGFMLLSTGPDGVATLPGLDMGTYFIRARDQRAGNTSSAGAVNAVLTPENTNLNVKIQVSGVGSITGTVFESDNTTPAIGAEVHVTGYLHNGTPNFNNRTLFDGEAVTDSDGKFEVIDVPPGPISISARLAALAASESTDLAPDHTNDVVLTLGPSGSVTGHLFRANGTTAVLNNEVLLKFKAPSGLDGLKVVRTDESGLFKFDDVPVGPLRVEASLPAVNGFAFQESTLFNNAQTLDLGNILLDEEWPRVLGMDPASASSDIHISSPVLVYFSEALDPKVIREDGIFIRSETTAVSASVALLPDPTNGVLRVVQITPRTNLLSLSTYRVVVMDGIVSDAVGKRIGQGPNDLVGRPLLTPFIGTFTTRDDDPPQLLSVFPTNNAVQIDPISVMRLSFNEPIFPGASFTVSGPNGPIPGSIDLGVNNIVLTFTPSQPLPLNSTLTLRVDGVQDLAGNVMLNQPVISTFNTLDTFGPEIQDLHLLAGQHPVASSTISLEAVLKTPETNVTVRFSQDLQNLGIATTSPFIIPAKLPATGRTIFRAIASDRFGNDGATFEYAIDVVPNQPPAVQLALVQPTNGVLGSSQPFTIALSATDDVGISNMTFIATGPLTTNLTISGGGPTNLTFTVPTNIIAGQTIDIHSVATDLLGEKSPEATLSLSILDQTSPTLTILSPSNNTKLDPRQPLQLVFAVSDNSSHLAVKIASTGVVITQQNLTIPLTPGLLATNTTTIDLANSPASGGSIVVSVTAQDDGTNKISQIVQYQLLDVTPPRFADITPPADSIQQSLWTTNIVINFGEDVARESVTSDRFALVTFDGDTNDFGLTVFSRSIRLQPSLPLQPGTKYFSIISAGITDAAGNPLVDAAGKPIPSGGLSNAFTTAAILNILPTNNTPVLGGDFVTAKVEFETGLGARFFRFMVNSNSPVDLSVSPNSTNVSTDLLVPLDSTNLTVNILASDNAQFDHAYALSPIHLNFLGNKETNHLPVVALSRLLPATGDLEPGQVFSVQISATSDNLISNLVLTASGPITSTKTFSLGGPYSVAFTLPANALPGSLVQLAAYANDGLGLTSKVTHLDLRVGAPPNALAQDTIIYSRLGSPNGSIWMVAADGTSDTQITTGEWPKLSPDNRYLAFHKDHATYSRGNIYVRDLLSGNERLVFGNNDFVVSYDWTQDSSQLVHDYSCSIETINPDGTGRHTLLNVSCYDDAPSINPIDGWIAFHNTQPNGGIGLADGNGANRTFIPNTTPLHVWPTWSPDGQWISFLDGTNYFKIRPDGSGLTQLTFLTGTNDTFNPVGPWTHDSSHIIAGGTISGTNAIFNINADGSGAYSMIPTTAGAPIDFVGAIVHLPVTSAPARLVSIDPASGSAPVSLWLEHIEYAFSDSIKIDPQIGNYLRLVDSNGLTISHTTSQNGQIVNLSPILPLTPAVTYTNILLEGLRDGNDLLVLDSTGKRISSSGMMATFRTAAIGQVTPTNGTTLTTGRPFTASVNFEAGLGARFARFQITGASAVITGIPRGATSVTAQLMPPTTSSGTLTISLSDDLNFSHPYSLPVVNFNISQPGSDLTLAGPTTITLTQGETTNILVTASSPAAPLINLSLNSALLPFVDAGEPVLTNSPTEGTGGLTIAIDSTFADPGNYTLTVLGTNVVGGSRAHTINLTVVANPGLAVTRWKDPISGNWNDPARWTAGLPSASLPGRIDAPGTYTVTLANDVTVAALFVGSSSGKQTLDLAGRHLTFNGASQIAATGKLFANGMIHGAGDLAVSGEFEWQGGFIQDSGRLLILPAGQLNLTGNVLHGWHKEVRNAGTISWSTGDVAGDSGSLYNLITGTLHIHANLTWRDALINNLGLITKDTTTGAALFINSAQTFNLNSAGKIDIQSGQIEIRGKASISGAVVLGQDTVLNCNGNTAEFLDSSSVTGAGELRVSNGTVNFTGTALPASANLVSGQFAMNANTLSVDSLNIQNGTLAGQGTLNVVKTFTWTGGNLADSGVLNLLSTATSTWSSNSKNLVRPLVNAGTVNWTGGLIYANGGSLENLVGATIDLQTDTEFYDGVFINRGHLLKSGGAGNLFIHHGFANNQRFENYGLIDIQSGEVRIDGRGYSRCETKIGANAAFTLNSPNFVFDSAATVTGPGRFNLTGGTAEFYNPSVAVPVNLTGGTFQINGASMTLDAIRQSSGAITGSGRLSINSSQLWTGGDISSLNELVFGPGCIATWSGTDRNLSSSVQNLGVIQWSGGRVFMNNGTLQNFGLLDIQFDGEWLDGVFLNTGTVLKSAGTDTASFRNYSSLQRFYNDGTVLIESGSITFTGGVTAQGGFNVEPGAGLIISGNSVFYPGSAVSGLGKLRFTGGNTEIQTPFLPTTIETANANVTFNAGPVFLDTLIQNSGTIAGSSDINVSNLYQWNGGYLTGSGLFNLLHGAVAIAANTDKYLVRTFNNHGVFKWNDGAIWGTGVVFNNASDGRFEISSDTDWRDGIFNNSGEIVKLAGTGTTLFRRWAEQQTFNNSGTVQIQSGTFTIGNTGSATGNFVVADGATLRFEPTTYELATASIVSGPGQVIFAAGIVNAHGRFQPGTFAVNQSATANFLDGAQLTIPQTLTVAGRLNLSSGTPQTFSSLTLTGTLLGSDNITINTALDWRGGEISGSGTITFTSQAAGSISTSGSVNLYRALTNHGTLTWVDGVIWASGGGIFNNAADGHFIIQSDTDFRDGIFNNSGEILKTGGAGTTTFRRWSDQEAFNNDGTVTVQSGTFTLSSTGLANGTFTIQNGAFLRFEVSTYTLNSSSRITGTGQIVFANGTVNISGRYDAGTMTINGTVNCLNGAQVTLPSSLTISGRLDLSTGISKSVASLTLNNNGTLLGSDDLTINSSLSWQGGEMSGTGSTTLASGATGTFSGSAAREVYRPFTNHGTITWLDGIIWGNAGGVFNNASDGHFLIQSDTDFRDGIFNNSGQVIKNAGTGTTVFRRWSGVHEFNNNGTILIQTGTLNIAGTGSADGTFTLQDNTTVLRFEQTYDLNASSTVSGPGQVLIFSGTLNVSGKFQPGTLTINGSANFLTGAQVTFPPTVNVAGRLNSSTGNPHSIGTLSMNNATLAGSDDITVTTALNWEAGEMSGTGSFTLAAGATATLGQPQARNQYKTFNNHGTVNWTDGIIWGNNGIFNNLSDGRLEIQSDTDYRDGIFNNLGQIVKTAGPGTTSFRGWSAGMTFNNGGVIDLQNGSLVLSSAGLHSGKFQVATNTTLNFALSTQTLTNGITFAGTGNVQINGAVDLKADLNFGDLAVFFNNPVGVTGTNTISNTSEGFIQVNTSMTFAGSLDIAGLLDITPNNTVTINGTLTLEATGELDNQGTLHVGAFGNAGKVTGNQPILNPPVAPLKISSIRIVSGSLHSAAAASTSALELLWSGDSGNFTLESTPDFIHWQPVDAPVQLVAPGHYRSQVNGGPGNLFFRLRQN